MPTTSTGAGNWTAVVGSLTISDDVVINHDVDLNGIVNMTGTITINAGKTLDTTSASNHNLTASANITVNGTLICNDSDVGAASIMGTGTLECDTATITLAAGGDIQTTNINMDAATILGGGAEGAFNLFGAGTAASPSGASTINISGSSAASITCRRFGGIWATSGASTVTLRDAAHTSNLVSGSLYNLTVNGSGDTFTFGEAITVSNNVTITAGTLAGGSANHSFGTLTVSSGGTYDATSGTTTIDTPGTSNSPQAMHTTAGTMNHNDGKVLYRGKGANQLRWGEGHVYDLQVECDGSSGSAIILEGDAGAGHVEVMNDLTLTNRSGNGLLCRMNGTAYDLTVHGDMYMKRGDSSSSSEQIYFYYNGDPTGNYEIKGKLHLSGNEHVRFRAPNSNGRLRVGSFINEGAYFEST